MAVFWTPDCEEILQSNAIRIYHDLKGMVYSNSSRQEQHDSKHGKINRSQTATCGLRIINELNHTPRGFLHQRVVSKKLH